MPVHDWTRLDAGDFHHFHQQWIGYLAAALNSGGLPPGFMAMAEQVTGRPVPDVVTLQSWRANGPTGGLAVATAPPSARVVARLERINYAKRADRIVIRHKRGRVIAVIELVSSGNKESRHALRSFVEKTADLLAQGIHLLIVDLYPPTPRDPVGLHKAIWDELADEPFDFLPDRPLTVASYIGGEIPTAYVESVGVGDPLPSMPIFLTDAVYVPCPLEATYMQAWAVFPEFLKGLMEAAPAPKRPRKPRPKKK